MNDFINLEAFKSLYNSDPIYIFDTNIYLDLLRFSKKASEKLIYKYKDLQQNIWVPNQVNVEFQKNISIVESQRITNAKKAIMEAKKSINTCNESIMKQLNFFIRYKFDNIQEIVSKVTTDLHTLKETIEDYNEVNVISQSSGFLDKQDINDFFNSVYNLSENQEFPIIKLYNIYKNGDIRYKYKIPPGYMDDPRNNSDAKKEGVSIFGDLVLWNEILDYGKENSRPIIFITSDVKEDWFLLKNGKPIAPRAELLREFSEITNGNEICILTSEKFIEYIGEVSQFDNALILAEMQKEDFADIAIGNNKDIIREKMIDWINCRDHVYLVPFNVEINKVTDIEDLTMVIQDVAVDVRDDVYYRVTFQATAELVGAYYDENIKRFTLNDQRESFRFNITISFKRERVTDFVSNDIFRKDIVDIEIESGEFERCILEEVELESKRGTFIKPNDNDYDIYNYMMSIWDKYNKENKMERAEALVYIDAANYFNYPLLEINRGFTLVQNRATKIELSLNEIDALALKRFADIGFQISGNSCFFDDKKYTLGEAYPLPESMKQCFPEGGKELQVDFTYEIVRIEDKYVQIKGKTTLPKGTKLIINFASKELMYRASSQVNVLDNGRFISEVFMKGSNQENNSIPDGWYTLEIIVPITSVQPESVQVAFGRKGKNLIGKYVSYDKIMGNIVGLAETIEIQK
ncbi:PIN-like domain-containing protein [Clostridium beijerinckii]|uniref:PIN like domain-containing protein n=1 Tax=Clostridium beijerinckii TaxID=1520 RepID=A0AAX0B1V6_CLOBE|nr:PIN-like domain-containing protein [Clostridium beijerinckii]NRT88917.1 hypothetical protein [Clostridium beijerinckii]NYC74372.1 hypothetical protein [Clostridium beijerinckii]